MLNLLCYFSSKSVLSLLLFIIFFFNINCYHALCIQLDSSEVYKVILDIGHYNDDCAFDTLIGTAKQGKNILPRFILWGYFSASYTVPDSLKVSYTEFVYPDWISSGASNIFKANNDSLTDIVFYYWGKISDSALVEKDSSVALMLFGQRGLDTIKSVFLESIDTFQISPFVAMNVRYDHELNNCRKRDLSFTSSYNFNTIDLDLWQPDLPPAILPSFVENTVDSEINIYPNPAVFFTNIELKSISPGFYNVSLVNLQGELISHQFIEVSGKKQFTKMLDLTHVSNGFYLIIIKSETELIGAYNIIIIH